ncbi:phage terminase large subunit GpA [Bacillus oleivorans]|uniref:Phage terminase large subunit GpA n=1 Tax=Bacillus oleivorans TaxID=1448271 RepID=A0A285CJV0_9BACI|nr:phage terminase large subunit family protein [Bacillus oleivorans]SNX67800.1 phage terminase large subunit GpA [Bacillus oleivorans]
MTVTYDYLKGKIKGNRQLKAQLLKLKQQREQVKNLVDIQNAYEWITKNNFVNENGIPMEFEDRSFLIAPLTDESPILAVIKCSQIGFSTISIFKSAFHNIKYGHNIIYTLPTDSDANEFAKAKTNLIIENNQSIKQTMIDNSLHTKSFRTLDGSNVGFWFMKGTYGQSAAIMQTADILIKDEFDRSNPSVLNQYKSRIKASSYKREWEFSNPSFPLFGVDATWEMSDQKHYFYKCPKCNHWSYITYEQESFDRGNTHHVDKERKEYVCGSCREILDRRQAKKQWVRKFTDTEDISGYWISQMMAPWISASELIRDEKLMLPDVFANFDLGRPYASNSNSLDPSNIIKNIVYDEYGYVEKAPGKYRVMGVDQGGTIDNPKFYCVSGTEEGINKIICLHGEEALHNFIKMNNINYVTIDNAPYPEIAVRLVKAFPGRIYRCVFDYKDERKNVFEVDYKTRIINVHRTRIFDRVVDDYIVGGRKVYIDGMDRNLSAMDSGSESLCKHWTAQRKVGGSGERPEDRERNKHIKLDKQGNVRPIWVAEGHDHYSLADIYCAVSQLLAKRLVEVDN